MSKTRDKEMTLICVAEAVDRALSKYASDNVDVVRNEETGMLDVIYHNNNNSFAIEASVVNPAHLNKHDKKMLARELDKRNVGHCW